MAADEATQSSATETDAPENAPASDASTGDDVAIDAQTWHLWRFSRFSFWMPFFFG